MYTKIAACKEIHFTESFKGAEEYLWTDQIQLSFDWDGEEME